MDEKVKTIIFTDLDGTLLDVRTYSYQKVIPLIEGLKRKEIPIIFCTAKTRAENEFYQKKLNIGDPFIAENGGAIFIPKGYFSFSFDYQKEESSYKIIELGITYSEIRGKIEKVRRKLNCNIIGFGDLSPEEVARITGLALSAARLAKLREYDETLIIEDGFNKKEIIKELESQGLQIQHGGRFYGVFSSRSSKGRAVEILTSLFRKEFDRVKTIGLGDSQNDFPMLQVVDLPILVQEPSGIWSVDRQSSSDTQIKIKNLVKIEGIGPNGWAKAVRKYVLL